MTASENLRRFLRTKGGEHAFPEPQAWHLPSACPSGLNVLLPLACCPVPSRAFLRRQSRNLAHRRCRVIGLLKKKGVLCGVLASLGLLRHKEEEHLPLLGDKDTEGRRLRTNR